LLGAALALVAAVAALAWKLLRASPHADAAARATAAIVDPPPPVPTAGDAPQPVITSDAVPPSSPVVRGESQVERVEPAAGGHPEWRPVTLSVLDRATREDLKDVEVAVEPLDQRGHRPIDDSSERKTCVRGDSPLTVAPALAGTACSGFLVRAAGHAAALVDLDFDAGGAREVLLEPACALRLRIDAPPANEKLVVQLRRIEDVLAWFDSHIRYLADCGKYTGGGAGALQRGLEAKADFLRRQRDRIEADPNLLARFVLDAPATWSRAAPRQAWIAFDHLPAGAWLAIVVPASALDAPRGAACAKLEAGGYAERTIELSDRDPVAAKRVRGIVELAPGWSEDAAAAIPVRVDLQRDVRLVGLPSEASERTVTRLEREGDSLRFAWDAGELAGGAWTAKLPQYGVETKFRVDVEDEAPQEILLAVGAPCDVVLTPIDAQTRARVPAQTLYFASGAASGFPVATASPRDGVYRFHAPLGRLSVYLSVLEPVTGYAIPQFAAFELAPGTNALTFEARSYSWLRVLLKDGDAVVPCLADECHVEAERADGGGGVIGGGNFGGRDVRWIVSSPGRYSVRVVGQPGFADSEPVEVDVVAGSIVDVTIPLKRAR
jgi:hypothetical protein